MIWLVVFLSAGDQCLVKTQRNLMVPAVVGLWQTLSLGDRKTVQVVQRTSVEFLNTFLERGFVMSIKVPAAIASM